MIAEDPEELVKLEKCHRYGHLFHRVRMLRLLKSEECSTLGEAAEALGYSRRQCQRWFITYREEGLGELLVSRVGERGPTELITEEAFRELEGATKRGEIATVAQAHRFLSERGVRYAHPESVGALLRQRKVKLKTSRPRHEKADTQEEQEAFKNLRQRGEAVRPRRERLGGGEAAEGDVLGRGALGVDQLAQEALLAEGLSPAVCREARLRVDLPVRSRGARQRGDGESFCLYLPGMDGGCLETFLEHLGEAYPDHRLLVVLDGAPPSHRSEEFGLPENVSLLRLPRYSPELNPVQRWFQEFRRALSNRTFESVELLQEALTKALEPYWEEPARLRRLASFSWWVEAVEAL